MIRLPSAREYKALPFDEKRRLLDQLHEIRLAYLQTEAPERTPAAS
mgnify:CR=1 FL=1